MIATPLLLLTALPTIWIVDQANGPGTNFTDLPPAVAAAQSGDTILVRAGASYTMFSVSGKALAIRGAGQTTTLVVVANPNPAAPGTTINAVPGGQSFYVSGITFGLPNPGVSPPTQLATLTVAGAGCTVVLSDVGVAGPALTDLGGSGLRVDGGATVHAARCTFVGGPANGSTGGANGGAAAFVGTGAVLAADSSIFTGGLANGTNASPSNYAIGGAGVHLLAGTATLSRCNVTGGTATATNMAAGGGPGIYSPYPGTYARISGTANDLVMGGTVAVNVNGGAAVITAGPVDVHAPVALLSGNPGGQAPYGPVTIGLPQLPTVSTTGTLLASGETDATQPVTVTVSGLPLAPFILALDFQPAFSTVVAPLTLGEVLLPLPTFGFVAGNLDAFGIWSATIVPAQAPWVTNVPIHLQAGVLDAAAGQIRLSGGEIRFFKI